MATSTAPPRRRRFYILNQKSQPVEVSDRTEWSRWMAGNDRVFRRTLLEESGITVTTRFCGVSEPPPRERLLFATRIAGGKCSGECYWSWTLDEAMEEHERLVQKLLRIALGR
ncbi:MAG: hypothetical protein ACREVW_13310 [Burkholderiales bacterium]